MKGYSAMNPEQQRALGAYYTPDDAAALMAGWVVGCEGGTILEPSFGDGVFIDAVRRVAGDRAVEVSLIGVEISPSAFDGFTSWGAGDRPLLSDIHTVRPFPVDAVIGNPPFVRYRNLPDDQARAARLAARTALSGATADESGSIWMSVALHSATFLRPGGRLALVLPADALYVKYALPFWDFMRSRFGSLRVLRTRERLFGDILQDVVILLADRYGSSTQHISAELYASRELLAAGRPESTATIELSDLLSGSKPFTKALLDGAVEELHEAAGSRLARADTYVKFGIGYVDACKEFFHPSPDAVKEYKLPARSLLPALRSGRHWKDGGYRTSTLPESAIWHLWLPDPSRLTAGERRYIEYGEQEGIHLGRKTRTRSPWFVVPDVQVPDFVVSVFGSLPKMMLNDGNYVVSNSIMRTSWRARPAPAKLLACWYSSITRLGIELAVHSLGGGVLVMVPLEGDSVLVPTMPTTAPSKAVLSAIQDALSAGDLDAAYEAGDAYLSRNGWSGELLEEARRLADDLRGWREDR